MTDQVSVIEKLDSVLALRDVCATGLFLRDHGPAIRQDMIDARRYRWLRSSGINYYSSGQMPDLKWHGWNWNEIVSQDELDAAIDALQATALPAVPEGMVLVPEAATHAMILAGVAAANRMDLRPLWGDLEEVWNAMLAATPAHDQPEGNES